MIEEAADIAAIATTTPEMIPRAVAIACPTCRTRNSYTAGSARACVCVLCKTNRKRGFWQKRKNAKELLLWRVTSVTRSFPIKSCRTTTTTKTLRGDVQVCRAPHPCVRMAPTTDKKNNALDLLTRGASAPARRHPAGGASSTAAETSSSASDLRSLLKKNRKGKTNGGGDVEGGRASSASRPGSAVNGGGGGGGGGGDDTSG